MSDEIKVPVTDGDEPEPAAESPADEGEKAEAPESEDAEAAEAGAEEPVDPVAALEEKLAAEHDKLLRAAADLDNLRKRSRRDVKDAEVRGRAEVLRAILPAIDSIDMALKSADPDGPASGVITGVEMVKRQFLTCTGGFGLKEVPTVGERFDPSFHEAVAQVASTDVAPGEVLEEMRSGYMLGERLVRPAMVVVATAPAEAVADSEDEEAEAAAPDDEDVAISDTDSEGDEEVTTEASEDDDGDPVEEDGEGGEGPEEEEDTNG